MLPPGEAPNCPVCSARGATSVLAWSGDRSILRCNSCELLFALPLPTENELHEFYQGFLYRKPSSEELDRGLSERQAELMALFGIAPGAGHGRRFLDQGGGTGLAYAAAKQLGLDSSFCDIDEQAIRYVQATFQLPEANTVRDLGDHPGQFDYVFSDNVIEHVPEPQKLLAQILACLKPGGTAIIKTPHGASTEMYFYPRIAFKYMRKAAGFNGWRRAVNMALRHPIWACDPPRHIYSFSEASVGAMALSLGLTRQDYEVKFYWTPLFRNTLWERAFKPRKRWIGRLAQAALAPILPFELATKAGQVLARKAGWITPGGLILRITRPLAS
jgi:SAM-dependent methyltransferase